MNEREEIVKEKLISRGLNVFRNGWPDFLVTDEKRKIAYAIEVKSDNDQLRHEQKIIHLKLAEMGIPTYLIKNEKDLDQPVATWKTLIPPRIKPQSKKFLNGSEMELVYSLNKGTLANMRSKKIGPKYYKVGGLVLYKAEDVEAWIEDHKILTTESQEYEEQLIKRG